MKRNCWEFKGCGREPGGKNAEGLGVCPAATYERLDGIHRGKNGGRVCWIIAGTMCGGRCRVLLPVNTGTAGNVIFTNW
ncbi:hypothetical protein BMS3Abin07_00576 [bacterium BMS3Abin07]|nr:hypothetical protein BMS3Abin07_00576 [bacterium BMS3Abin07]GBE32860.1 hypothetical protein BMS3Bbin05_01788 [bacterium BMS3Bbin05]